MYINRALLLMLGIAFIFYPAVESWLLDSGAAWHRLYQLWLLVIIAAYWNLRSRDSDEL